MLREYYQEELQALRELGKEFAEGNPAIAGLISHAGSDPDVERLLQGFAFLTGRVRERLDDDFPEIVHVLLDMVAPQYVRQMPSCVVLEAAARRRGLTGPKLVPAGVEVVSKGSGSNAACVFRTTRSMTLSPLEIVGVELQCPPGERPKIRLELVPSGKLSLGDCLPERLQLHAHGDLPNATELHRALVSKVERIHARPRDRKGPVIPIGSGPLEAMGFDVDDSLQPTAPSALPGHWLLLEYFTFPQKFLFCELALPATLAREEFETGVALELELTELPAGLTRVGREDLRLHCVPAINLYPADAKPVRVLSGQSRYLVRPEGYPDQLVHSVVRVAGLEQRTANEIVFPDYFWAGGVTMADRPPAFFQVEREPSVTSETPEHFIRFVSCDGDHATPATQALSIDLLVTDGRRAERILPGEVSQSGPSCPEFATFASLERPTLTVEPPIGKGLYRRLLSHLSLGVQTLASLEGLRELCALYDFAGLRSAEARKRNVRRIEGLVAVTTKGADWLHEGGVLRGIDVQLDLRASHFAGIGDLYLFASILERVLGLHVTVNQFTRLTVTESDTEEKWEWPIRSGTQTLL